MSRKKHLYLHIGTNKTGSSSIQNFLIENREFLASEGYDYPTGGAYFYPPEASASLLAHAIHNVRPAYVGNVEINLDACVSDIRRDISQSAHEKIILSSEHFSKCEKLEEIRKIYEVFSDLFEKITVIIYLRRQDAWLESSWSQMVKTGAITTSFDDFLKGHSGWNYFEIMKPWMTVFGKDNMVIRPFERMQFVQNDLTKDFLNIVGIKADIAYAEPKNVSPPLDLLEILRLFGATIPNYSERRSFYKMITSLPISVDKTKFTLFTPEKRKAFLDAHRESNKQVAKEYLSRPDGVLFYESENTSIPVYPGVNFERFSIISRQIITFLLQVNIGLSKQIKK